MSSDNKRSDEYWMGVRDALRMVDSFNKWAVRNPGRAKSLDDFIHDGLIAAAKRCESCLREKLGLSFIDEEPDETDSMPIGSTESEITPPPGYESAMEEAGEEPIDSIPDTSYEIAVESTEHDSQEIPIDSDDSSISIDAVERLGTDSLDDIIIESPQRDFSSDFVLVEPPPLVVDAEGEYHEESEEEEVLSESYLEDIEVTEEPPPEPEVTEKSTAFTWSDYEAAVTPASEPESEESDDDYSFGIDDHVEKPSEQDAYPSEEESKDEPPQPAEIPKDWSAYDYPSVDEEDITEEIIESEDEDALAEMDDTEDTEPSEATHPITEPPAPPPPPESEEDEEERKRRARRLFFGS